jgi:hypothetical protein
MDPKISALERAFQIAESGRVSDIKHIRAQLKREGYDERVLDSGRSLTLQLRGLIKAAHSGAPKSTMNLKRRPSRPLG